MPILIQVQGVFANEELGLDVPHHAAIVAQGFAAEQGQTATVPAGEGAIVLLGLGDRRAITPESVHRAIGRLRLPAKAQVTSDLTSRLVGILPPEVSERVVASAFAELRIALTDIRSTSPHARVPSSGPARIGELEAEAVMAAREWTNAPAQDLTPASFAAMAVEIAEREALQVEVLGPQALQDAGFGGISSIGAGSPHPPQLVDLRFEPPRPRARICLVGKGITFDTGGLSLKTPTAMSSMRMDKAGAAAVLAVMSVVSRLGVPISVRGLLPLAENMIGPNALRPGDITTAWNGTRIQVMDTDFEGRVILADALAYGCADAPDVIIDIATLTYQAAIALGPEIGALISRHDELARGLGKAADDAGEPLWRLPYADRYLGDVLTATGVKNHPESDTGRALTAALFLGQFVPPDIPWAHLDITGPAWIGKASADGATGFGVRTLIQFVLAQAALPTGPLEDQR